MTPQDVLELPHTVDEALDVLRAYDPAQERAILKGTVARYSLGEDFQASVRDLDRRLRWACVDALEPIVDAMPMLSHKSCRSAAVIAPRWRKLRDRKALDFLLSKLADTDHSGSPAIDLHPVAFGVDESTEPLTESPPLVDRYEPADLRGPPAPRLMPMHGPWTVGYSWESEVTAPSDTAAVRHTTASAWVLSKGGERT
jgi:hypothetical protein